MGINFNPYNNPNINFRGVEANKTGKTNEQQGENQANKTTGKTFTPKEVQASALELVGDLNRSLVVDRNKDKPNIIDFEDNKLTTMANWGHFDDSEAFTKWQNKHISEFELGDTVSVGNTNYVWGAVDMGNGTTMYRWIAQ